MSIAELEQNSASPKKPETLEDIAEHCGLTEAELRQAQAIADIPQNVLNEIIDQIVASGESFTAQLVLEIYNKKSVKRGLGKNTVVLREAILNALNRVDKPVTVRQTFYLLTTTSDIDKTEKGYGKVQRQLVAMRREGLIPYDWIADNTRWMRKPNTYDSLEDFLWLAQRQYRQSLWVKSPVNVEIWCEKDALAGVISPITSEFDVPLMVTRGYSSESFAYSAAQNIVDSGKPTFIYYVGDFDPSGWHMSQDLNNKLVDMVGNNGVVMFERLAVNPTQIKLWNLPERPTKKTDSRAKGFYKTFGNDALSVELDAIHPDQLKGIIRNAIEQHTDPAIMVALQAEEEAARESLREFSENLYKAA